MKLGSYILGHDEKSFYISNGKAEEINYSSSTQKAVVNGTGIKLQDRTSEKYLDYKITFDELNFEDHYQAVEKLEEVAKDIAKININKANKSTIDNKQIRINESFDNLSQREKALKVREQIKNHYKNNDKVIDNKVLAWERDKDGWGNEIVNVRVKKYYGRTENMEKNIISIHTKSSDETHNSNNNYKIKPHLHITIPRNHNWGKNLCYLEQTLSQILTEHNLTSSRNGFRHNKAAENYSEYRTLKDRLSNFSWVVAKHENPLYAKKKLNQYRGENAITLSNVENRLNRYLELGGSVDFAKKLQMNLENKFDMQIDIKLPENYQIAEQNIEQGNYKKIINEVRNNALNGEKISEKYKNYANEVLNNNKDINNLYEIKDMVTAKAIKEIVKSRGYKLDHNFNKIIDRVKINGVADHEIEKIEHIKLTEKIANREYLNQNELRDDIKRAGITDVSEVSHLSPSAITFQSNEKFVRENINIDWYSISEIKDIRNEVENIKNWDTSEGYKEQISKKIYWERFNDIKEIAINNIDFDDIDFLNAFENINNKINNLDLDISEEMKNQIIGSIYKEKIDNDKVKEAYRKKYKDKAEKIKALKNSYKQIKGSIKALKDNLNNLTEDGSNPLKEIEKLFKEMKSELNQISSVITKAYINIKQWENMLQRADNLFNKLDINITQTENKLNTLSNQLKKKKSKTKTNRLRETKEKLNKEIKTIEKSYKSKEKDLDNIEVGIKEVENKIEEFKDEIRNIKKEKESTIKKVFGNPEQEKKERIDEIKEKVKKEKNKLEKHIKNYKEIEENLKDLKDYKNKLKDRADKIEDKIIEENKSKDLRKKGGYNYER